MNNRLLSIFTKWSNQIKSNRILFLPCCCISYVCFIQFKLINFICQLIVCTKIVKYCENFLEFKIFYELIRIFNFTGSPIRIFSSKFSIMSFLDQILKFTITRLLSLAFEIEKNVVFKITWSIDVQTTNVWIRNEFSQLKKMCLLFGLLDTDCFSVIGLNESL